MENMTKEEQYQIFEKMFKDMINRDFHKEDIADVSTVAVKNFLLYSESVILERAIPDLRDGLKPSQRRPIYVMKDMGISYSGAYKKSARITGATIGLYHPHGDTSVYEAMTNMSQDWKQNLPLIEGQGNWGSIDGDNPASPRYTEARLTIPSVLLFNDINKGTVDFVPNYDGLETEPEVLPAPIPLILLNGVLKGSIAVGMDSEILPHNSSEIMSLMLDMIEKRKLNIEFTSDDFLKHVPGPDLPTGGTIYNIKDFKKIIETGKGSVSVRSKYMIEKEKNKTYIVITEIPYGKIKTKLIDEVISLKANNKENKFAAAIVGIIDHSGEGEIRIDIEVKKGWDPEEVWNYILSKTSFDTNLFYRATVIDKCDGKYRPKEYGLLQIMNRFLDHRFEITTRKYEFILNQSEERLHINEGLIIAIDIIDEVISIIKKSQNPATASKNLMEKIGLSERQAKAILDMKLARLTSMQKKELLDKKRNLKSEIKNCKTILSDFDIKCDLIYKETLEQKDIISKERKSELVETLESVTQNVEIPKENCKVQITKGGYVKRVDKIKDIILNEDDYLLTEIETNTHAKFNVVTKEGVMHSVLVADIPNSSKGSYIKNIVDIDSDIAKILITEKEFEDNGLLLLITKKGLVKKINMNEVSGSMRKSGIKVQGLNEGDSVIEVETIIEDKILTLMTTAGKLIRFNTSEISIMGRSAKGVRGIKLKENDYVLYAKISEDRVYVITENFFLKAVDIYSFKVQSRGGIGVFFITKTKASGEVSNILESSIVLTKNNDIIDIYNDIDLTAKNMRPIQLDTINSNVENIHKNNIIVD